MAPTNIGDKADFCAELSHVAGIWNHPWILGGDFNVIRFPNEKKGGCAISPAMRDFSNWIRFHDLVDLPLRGTDFPWTDIQTDPVLSRLDRFLLSTDWLDLFPDWQKALLLEKVAEKSLIEYRITALCYLKQ